MARPAGVTALAPGAKVTTPAVVETLQMAPLRRMTWRVEPEARETVALAFRAPAASARTPLEVPAYSVAPSAAAERRTEAASTQEAAMLKAPLETRRPMTFLLAKEGAVPGATDQQGTRSEVPSAERPM